MTVELKVLFINLATLIISKHGPHAGSSAGRVELREQEISLSEGVCQEERLANKET